MRAAVFDFDGVLVDSEPLHFQAMRDSLLPEGFEITTAQYYASYIGYDDWGALRLAFEEHGISPVPERLAAAARRKKACFAEVIRDVRFFPGRPRARAGAFGRDAGGHRLGSPPRRDRGDPRGGGRCATRSPRSWERRMRLAPSPIPRPTSRRPGFWPRTTPGLRPADCLAFEDSVAGVVSALGAGMKVVAVTTSYPAEKLRSAHRVVSSLAELERGALQALFAA